MKETEPFTPNREIVPSKPVASEEASGDGLVKGFAKDVANAGKIFIKEIVPKPEELFGEEQVVYIHPQREVETVFVDRNKKEREHDPRPFDTSEKPQKRFLQAPQGGNRGEKARISHIEQVLKSIPMQQKPLVA